MWELYRKDDGLLQRFLRHLQTGDIVPLNVGFVHNDRVGQTGTKLLDLRVMFIIVIFPEKRTINGEIQGSADRTTYFFPAAPEPPLTTPFAPTAFFFEFSPAAKCCFNVSALVKYSLIFDRISCFDFAFFSSG